MFSEYPGVTQMHGTLQETYYWPQMATSVTRAVRYGVYFAKH